MASARIDEHAATSLALDQLLVDQLLIALQNRERIDPIFGRDVAHGGQRIAFLEHAVEYHRDDPVAKLAVNRLTVVPLTIHHGFQITLTRDAPLSPSKSVRLEILRRAEALLRMTPFDKLRAGSAGSALSLS